LKSTSIPDLVRIELHAVTLEELQEFIFKGNRLVMFFLPRDVPMDNSP